MTVARWHVMWCVRERVDAALKSSWLRFFKFYYWFERLMMLILFVDSTILQCDWLIFEFYFIFRQPIVISIHHLDVLSSAFDGVAVVATVAKLALSTRSSSGLLFVIVIIVNRIVFNCDLFDWKLAIGVLESSNMLEINEPALSVKKKKNKSFINTKIKNKSWCITIGANDVVNIHKYSK